VVLAMPKRSLELITQTGPLFCDPTFQRLHATVTPLPIFKMFSCYDRPWWKPLGYAPNGMAMTDMPLRTCLYWGTEGDQPGADPKNQNSLALSSFDDARYAAFWGGLRDPHHLVKFQPSKGPPLFGLAGSPEWTRYSDCVTDRIVVEAQKQLSEVHGFEVPEPYAVASMDWAGDPFGGAGNLWNLFARSEDVVQAMLRPVPSLPVFVCGEAYSRNQGWVEGALETTEKMLQQYFDLKPPAWFKATETP
jgi:monoamine oxidase